MQNLCRIRSNLQFEPLCNQWYVCLPMLAPVPSAMVLAFSQIPIMQSYIESPDEHLSLSQELSLTGGPFINYSTNRAEEIKQLLEKIMNSQKHVINFANSVKALTCHLEKVVNGYSLEPEYNNIPDPLRGYVELVYDMCNKPSLRFIEALLYKSRYYCREAQSVCCSLISVDERPFVLSTPRLIDEQTIQINIPFDSPLYDELSRMREEPRDFNQIVKIFGFSPSEEQLFKSFVEFTDQPKKRPAYLEENIRIRYFGHACLLIEYKGISILTDPFISYEYQAADPRYSFADLPESIDYVIISHGHLDHIVLETLLQIRYKVKHFVVPRNSGAIYADPSLKMLLLSLGFKSILELDELSEIINEDVKIVAMPFFGEHHDLNVRAKTAYLLTIRDKKIYIAADSSNLDAKLYDHIYDIYGAIDLLFLGMECDGAPLSWFYGPLMPKKLEYDKDNSRQGSGSDFDKAISIVNSLQPKTAYVYAMGMEPWFRYVLGLNYEKNSKQLIESDKFIAECKRRGIYSERLFCKKEIMI